MSRVKYGDDRNAGQQDCATKCRYLAGNAATSTGKNRMA
jgi:hypothetical protein